MGDDPEVWHCAAMGLAERMTRGMDPRLRHYRDSPWQKRTKSRDGSSTPSTTTEARRDARKRQRTARRKASR